MNTPRQLIPSFHYSICKLLRRNLSSLKSVVAPGASITANSFNDLNVVIESLYLEPGEINSVVKELERLAFIHQQLLGHGDLYKEELQQYEKDIFWLLGYKYCPSESQQKVLIVDDQVSTLNLLSRGLKRYGYETYTLKTGENATLITHAFRPNVVLLDVVMPDISGYEVCTRLKELEYSRDIPVMFVSSAQEATCKSKAIDCGAADYITKPFQLKNVAERIDHVLQ